MFFCSAINIFTFKAYSLVQEIKKIDIQGRDIMKTLTVKDNIHGRRTEINANTTYQTASGDWIAEVNDKEMHRACYELYRGVKECRLEDMHIEAAQDDDGKEYTIVTNKSGEGP
jgi:hypothetical protein